ncbi:hypothetical protein F383_27567 [Gossypium arboreum]|uniref:Thioredoxin domain-containing protein n=1 Tax=Gossypium arboreum TaxID=29729 RepID=A0A0B0PFS6_GOSAR|nr:hypothetical protein F383_27567 [Gossypium arboreum]
MADAIRLLSSSSSSLIHSLRFSSPSLLTTFHFASNYPLLSLGPTNQNSDKIFSYSSSIGLAPLALIPRKPSLSFKVHATVEETEQPKWWERNAGPNMIDIHSTKEFISALSEAGDRLVIVEFYGTWCASCRALFPKVLPYFHFYRGADGQLESFSCSLAKFQKIKDAIEMHNTARCSIGPPKGVGDLNLESVSAPKNDKPTGSS